MWCGGLCLTSLPLRFPRRVSAKPPPPLLFCRDCALPGRTAAAHLRRKPGTGEWGSSQPAVGGAAAAARGDYNSQGAAGARGGGANGRAGGPGGDGGAPGKSRPAAQQPHKARLGRRRGKVQVRRRRRAAARTAVGRPAPFPASSGAVWLPRSPRPQPVPTRRSEPRCSPAVGGQPRSVAPQPGGGTAARGGADEFGPAPGPPEPEGASVPLAGRPSPAGGA